MKRKIKQKYFFWAILVFGMLGVYSPTLVRIIGKEENILILNESAISLSTYAVSILATSVYLAIQKASDGSDIYVSKLFDYIGYLVGSIIYIIAINYILSLEGWYPYCSIFLSIVGTLFSFRFWFEANEDESFGIGALGYKQ